MVYGYSRLRQLIGKDFGVDTTKSKLIEIV